MKIATPVGVILACFYPGVNALDADVLSDRIMTISLVAAELSLLTYDEKPSEDGYEHFKYFTPTGPDPAPDAAIVARKNGYCYVAFRGTLLRLDDWLENIELGIEDVCQAGNNKRCCKARSGFSRAFFTSYRSEMEKALLDCTNYCVNKDECVVLTGHSQGGAVAAVAAVYMADLNPYVITFGQPATIHKPCPVIRSNRWYRYVNSKSVESGTTGIAYDLVPFVTGFGADQFGHMIILSDDPINVAYIGLDTQESFNPWDVTAHSMGPKGFGYLGRIKTIVSSYSIVPYPVNASGYSSGSLCSKPVECASGLCAKEKVYHFERCIGTSCQRHDECETGERCDSGVCQPKLSSCMKCDEHSDCFYGKCFRLRCSGENKLMDNGCLCFFDWDCHSGRCQGIFPRVCKAKLLEGDRSPRMSLDIVDKRLPVEL